MGQWVGVGNDMQFLKCVLFFFFFLEQKKLSLYGYTEPHLLLKKNMLFFLFSLPFLYHKVRRK